MDADDLIDARLREAGARWRESNTAVAQAEPPAAAPRRRSNPPARWAPLLSAAVLAAALVVGGWFVLNRNDSTPSADGSSGLTGTVWQLLGYGNQQADTGSSAMLYIDRAGHLVADDDCALLVGTAHTDGDSLRVAKLAVRAKSCTDQTGAAFAPSGADVLRGPATYKITGATLTITRSGEQPMHLRRASNTTLRPSADVPTLVGADWQLEAITDPAGTRTAPHGAPRLHIADDGTLVATDGCNSLSGPVTLPSGELRFGDLATTLIGCIGPVGASASAVDAILTGSVTQTVQGNQLTLTKEGVGSLLYLWKPQGASLTDSQSLIGRTWRLASVAGDPAASTTATLSVSHGRIVVQDGCRDAVGAVAVSAGGLVISGLPAARPSCGGAVGEQAVTIDSIVRNGRVNWSIRDGQLIVPGGGAQAFALVFRSAAPAPDPAAQLVGPMWRLTQYERTTATTSSGASATSKQTLSFDGNGHYVDGACSPVGGSVVIGVGTLTLSGPYRVQTGPQCVQSRDRAQYEAVSAVLRGGRVTWTVQGNQLTITRDGAGALTYRRS